ncbi:MAG: hypothetical protein ACI93G_001107 [Hyphomonas sp.]|jgi:hypothetical protein
MSFSWRLCACCSPPRLLLSAVKAAGGVMLIAPRHTAGFQWWLCPFFWNQKRKYSAVLDTALLGRWSPRLFEDRIRTRLCRGDDALRPGRRRRHPLNTETAFRRGCNHRTGGSGRVPEPVQKIQPGARGAGSGILPDSGRHIGTRGGNRRFQ